MNIWIAKLGPRPFSEADVTTFDTFVSRNIDAYPSLKSRESFQYHAGGVHYLSACSTQEFSSKTYNYTASDALYAFSGLLVGKGPSTRDYRSAETLEGRGLHEIAEDVCGQYAIVYVKDGRFECVTDTIGSHKVFYCTLGGGSVYVTNHISLMQLWKAPSRNMPALAEWIATGELFGYATQETDVATLPEYGRLRWSTETGLDIDRYATLSTLVHADSADERELLNETACELKAAATYLAGHHRNALSLSGGYDSRLVISMFAGMNPEAIECFTYPDHRNDLRIARSVAARYGFRHTTIRASAMPSLEDLDRFLANGWGLPFPDYRRVFDYVVYEGISAVLQPALKVRVIGLGGDLDLGLKKFPDVDSLSPPKAIAAFADRIIRHDVLTPDGDDLLRQRLRDYLSDKYLPLLESADGQHRLTSMYFHLDRFRGLQGYKQSQSVLRLSDVFLPFASRRFIQTAFAVRTEALHRSRPGSVHHRLERALIAGRLRGMPFSSQPHWDSGRVEKYQFSVQMRLASLSDRMFGRTKYATEVRMDSVQRNLKRFSLLVDASQASELWGYVDRGVVQGWLSGTRSISTRDLHVLHRILPSLTYPD
jgi:hypothetical protein